MTCSFIPQFSCKDVVAVRVKNVRREGDSFVFVSAYMALKEPASPIILKELLSFSDRDKIPIVIGTDANAHHTSVYVSLSLYRLTLLWKNQLHQ